MMKPSPKLRGRPALTEIQVEGMRHRIVEVARTLFQSEGYHSISMRRIAKEIGCTPMSLYTYFDAKIDILRALWQDVFHEVFEQVRAATPKEGSDKAKIHAQSLAYVNYWLSQPEKYRLVFMSAGVEPNDVHDFVDRYPASQYYDIFSDLVSAALKLPIAETRVIAQTLICGLNGIAYGLIAISGYPWESSQQLVRVLVNGLLFAAEE